MFIGYVFECEEKKMRWVIIFWDNYRKVVFFKVGFILEGFSGVREMERGFYFFFGGRVRGNKGKNNG